ncbi:MAG: TonB-dependent receptor [Saprospiraceae bacterium]|nr:TonB-dependent receptor [Saprospiraceae bacterium]
MIDQRINVTFLLCLFLFTQSWAQISGSISDGQGEHISFANAILLRSSDSSIVKVEVSDLEGTYRFNKIVDGSYMVKINYLGFVDYLSSAFAYNGDSYTVPSIELQAQAQDLEQVVVKSTRPIVEVHPDKTVFNVEGSINAVGNTALELLRKSPGVVVDNNDNLILQGKNGVQVYIDGKPSPLSAQDLANYLKSMQSTEIDAIEIITNPSAKYDAEGNAGIINIRLKKNQNLGFNGSTNLGFAYAMNPRINGSINFNYRKEKFNAFGNYSVFRNRFENEFFLYREQFGNIYDQINKEFSKGLGHNYKFGTDFFINKKNTIGFQINGNVNDFDKIIESDTEISALADEVIDSFLVAENNEVRDRNNLNINLNYSFDNGDNSTVNIDLDYGGYRNNATSFQPNRYLGPGKEATLFARTFSNVTPTDIDIYTAKFDVDKKAFGGKLGFGAKSSLVITDNIFDFFDFEDGQRIKNLDRSNQFIYEENVNAAYLSWQKKFGEKIDFMIGLRSEHTHSKGDLTSAKQSDDEVVERDYLNFFPSGGITYQANKDHSFRINYSRRIDRPNYQNLNPFEFKLNELTFARGNPFLNPQYSNSYSLTHTYKYSLNSSLSYTVINDVYTQITDALGENAATLSWVNLSQQKNLALSISYPFSIAKWWNTYSTFTAFQLKNQASIEGKIIDLTAHAFTFYGQHTFTLPKKFKAELSGWYNAPTLWGNWVTKSQYDITVGVAKSFWNETATLKLSVSDLFYTNRWGGESEFGALYMRGGGQWESRQVRLNFTYLFGNKQVKGARRRSTGLEDEQRRI